jgi:hypothetical protein
MLFKAIFTFNFSNFLDAPFYIIGRNLLHVTLWLLASLSPILAIVAATLAMHELVDLNNIEYATKDEPTIQQLKDIDLKK